MRVFFIWDFTVKLMSFTEVSQQGAITVRRNILIRLSAKRIPPGSRQLNGWLHLCTAIFFPEMPNVCLFWPISSLWGIQWRAECVLPKSKVRTGVRSVRLIEWKAIIRCIQQFIYLFIYFPLGSNSGNWNRGTCQRPIGSPVSEINKGKK